MHNELLYQIALTLIPNIGDVHAKALINNFGNAKDIFTARKKDLETLEGIGSVRANSIKHFEDFAEHRFPNHPGSRIRRRSRSSNSATFANFTNFATVAERKKLHGLH